MAFKQEREREITADDVLDRQFVKLELNGKKLKTLFSRLKITRLDIRFV